MKILYAGLAIILMFVVFRTSSSQERPDDEGESYYSIIVSAGSRLFTGEHDPTADIGRIGKENIRHRERRKASKEEEGWFVFNQNSVFCFLAMTIFTMGMLVSVYLACCKDENRDKGMIGNFMSGGMPF
ncbi:hypothetical protein HOLleu_20540 [Holothuria leucospilota]|uniref:Uncharacterized protein n=1 Tax=Holothuria leucospilota TaxID=206669 RepID=A0A9Q1C1P4_HOLLE|nr:hypothetical protein HOLleu_20540 [Holothuria leucospilota]